MICDLHLHTTASDGSFTPREIVNKVKRAGIKFCSLNDHDCVRGLSEGIKRGKEIGVEVIRGIELSTYSENEVHILGYAMRLDDAFMKAIDRAVDYRKVRNLEMLDNLRRFGMPIREDELYDGKGVTKGRLHIAKIMVAKKYSQNVNEAFDEWIGANGKAYVKAQRLSPEEGIEIIKRSGGIPVLAHPSRRREESNFKEFFGSLLEAGLMGIEVFYPSHTPEDRYEYIKLAREHNLVITGGSDFHTATSAIRIGSGNADLSLETIEFLRKTNTENGD